MSQLSHDNKGGGTDLFNKAMFGYFLPYIRCVTEVRRAPSDCTAEGYCFVFRVYFSHQLDVEFGFAEHQEAAQVRRDLILHMIDFWGTDIVFLDGFNSDVTVLPAILDVTELFEKDGRACFSVILADVPHPVHLVCKDLAAAQTYHQCLAAKIEQRRRRAGLLQHQKAAAIA